ncbi:hypothetical protein PS862_02834 [Pseudomonas fluorescens]|uniref:Uncharacterized protein n=1 Tax=Pseudomonas fluorescens TaxID=294 RepID=A0A5E7KJ15_PSEFL|nr:hypothetical protein [Pseudomonas fluorescens]VVP00781.1 hypothetical protein PS862_02834 [Pseudomonas fluorescens]
MRDVVFVDGPESFLSALDQIRDFGGGLPVFRGWPIFDVKVEGDRYKGTLTPKLMLGLIEFQEQLMRAYTEIRYGSSSLAKLTAAEKAELELIFHITEGSTDGQGPLDNALNKIISALPMSKMSGGQVTALLIVAVLCFAGYMVFSGWNHSDLEKAKLASADKTSQTQAALVSKLADALASSKLPPEAVAIKDRAAEGYRAIVIGAPDASSIDIQGEHFNADELDKIRAQEPPIKTRQERREDVYIEMIKRHPEYLSLTLRLPGQDYTFPGRVDLSKFDQQKINQLFDSLRDSSPLRIFHYSAEQKEKIVRTDVLAVDDITVARSARLSQQ